MNLKLARGRQYSDIWRIGRSRLYTHVKTRGYRGSESVPSLTCGPVSHFEAARYTVPLACCCPPTSASLRLHVLVSTRPDRIEKHFNLISGRHFSSPASKFHTVLSEYEGCHLSLLVANETRYGTGT